MTDIMKLNADIAARYGEVKDAIAQSETIGELFETWLTEMQWAFNIPFLWVTLLDDDLTTPIRAILVRSPLLRDRLNIVHRSWFEDLMGGIRAPILVNDDLRPFYRLFPKHKYLLRSLALAPIRLGEEIVGSLNHGDPSPDRYSPEMDTLLLESLADFVSRRLTELVYLM